jgi:hypothetical protein
MPDYEFATRKLRILLTEISICATGIWSFSTIRVFPAPRGRMQNLETINVTEILDRVLDHGIVMEPSTRLAILGVELHKLKGRFIVEWVQTFC